MPKMIMINLSKQDERNIERIQERHPTWSEQTIIPRALGFYANNLEPPRPAKTNAPRSALVDIEELFGS